MSNEEKLRLLFIEQENLEANRARGVASQGAAHLIGRWPSYLASAAWCVICVISLATLLVLLIFMALLNQGKIIEQNVYIPKDGVYMVADEVRNEFCNQMTSRRHARHQDFPEDDLEIFNAGNNVFYLAFGPIDHIASCAIESLIRKCPDKNVFLMFLKKVQNHQYEDALKNEYTNFNLLHVDGKKLLRGSPFEGHWEENERSKFEVGLLTIWQFGGAYLSERLLLLEPRLLEAGGQRVQTDCRVDPELIFCPLQCAAYLYELIGVTLGRRGHKHQMEEILDESVKRYCGAEHLMKTGCPGVSRIETEELCDHLGEPEYCAFVRLRQELWAQDGTGDSHGKGLTVEHCPLTGRVAERLKRLRNDRTATAKTKATSALVGGLEETTQETVSNKTL